MKYKVTINWHGEVHKFYTHAKNETIALNNACRQLSKKLGITPAGIRAFILDGKDRWKVEVKDGYRE